MKKDKAWIYEKQAMAKKFIAVMGYRVPIRDVPDEVETVAYSTAEPAIYIKRDSHLTEKLDDHKARAIRFGLFTHEMGHHQFTDFDYMNKVVKDLEPWEVPVFKLIFNICEDPAIENMIPTIVGGYLLKSMKYAIKVTYEASKPINTYEDPFQQCITAMTQFGDMGPLKGYFKSPLAKSIFFRVITTMQDVIDCGDPKKRVDLSKDVFEEMRPLWEEMAKSSYIEYGEEGLKGLIEGLMGAMGKGFSGGMGSGEELDPEEVADAADLSKGARRTTTFKKLEDMDEEERKKYEPEEPEEETLVGGEEEEEASDPVTGSGMISDESTVIYTDEEIDLSTGGDYDPDEYEMDVEGFGLLDRLIQAEVEIDAATASKTKAEEIPEFKEIDKKYDGRDYKCANVYANISASSKSRASMAYEEVVKKNLSHINNCYKKLKALFAEEAEETEYKSSGKISVERTMSSTVTSKIFTKTVDPKDKSNMAVMLAVDESGSMSGSRIDRAKEAAINLAEIFAKLGIPTYIMGYTADTSAERGGKSYDAVHYHYVTWDNSKDDRIKLTSLTAKANNFDGYSIRYASKLLGLRPETHKVLIVISDGQPACDSYSWDGGYRDTKDAIREARGNDQVVLGVAIGADEDTLQKMYGRDFIFITLGEDLFTGIMKKFTEMVKKW